MAACRNPDCPHPDYRGSWRGMCTLCYQRAYRATQIGEPWPDYALPSRHDAASLNQVNPWAARHACPLCGSSEWTMPYDTDDYAWLWRLACCDTDAVLTSAGLIAREHPGQHLTATMFDPAPV